MRFSTVAAAAAMAGVAIASDSGKLPCGEYDDSCQVEDHTYVEEHPVETSTVHEYPTDHPTNTTTYIYPTTTYYHEYTTEVVTEYTTYCPEPTTFTYGTVTYTVTEVSLNGWRKPLSRYKIQGLTLEQATTITITDCPCTVTKPVITSTVTECHEWYVT